MPTGTAFFSANSGTWQVRLSPVRLQSRDSYSRRRVPDDHNLQSIFIGRDIDDDPACKSILHGALDECSIMFKDLGKPESLMTGVQRSCFGVEDAMVLGTNTCELRRKFVKSMQMLYNVHRVNTKRWCKLKSPL